MDERSAKVLSYVRRRGWLSEPCGCTFLAAGEYNENYLLQGRGGAWVCRINHGTQLGLKRQVEYEYQVLEAVYPSGVTPQPLAYSQDGEDLGNGVLLMEYRPGRPLDYMSDLAVAAEIFAAIHTLAPDPRLLVQNDAVAAITAESLGLLQRYQTQAYPEVRLLLEDYHRRIEQLSAAAVFAGEGLVMVNTEVNSGNFLIDPAGSSLVDWEKAVVSCRYQDLAHFLVPTTTLWKTDCRLSPKEKREFLDVYRRAGKLTISLDELEEKTTLMEQVILLRALSWCYMAYHEYAGGGRALQSSATFAKILAYLDEARCFLA
jgi:Phosphotransferase enzyme family